MPTPTEPDAPLLCASLLTDGHHVASPTWTRITSARDSGDVMWLDVERPGEAELRRIAQVFGLHEEMVEDSSEFHQRTRLADYDGYLLVVMYAVAEDTEQMVEVHLYVTSRQIVSIRRGPCPPLEELHDRADRAVTSRTTVPALLSRILSALVGTFSDALELVDDQLTDLESRILNDPLSKEQLDELLQVRRRVSRFRRAVDPARDLVGAGRFLVIDALDDVSDDARRHLRDLAVDLAHVGDQLEGERDRLSAVMDVYMNQVNNRQNRVMQQLAAVSTVFLPLTFLTGYFGMNFASMVRDVSSPVAFVLLGVVLPLSTLVFALVVVMRRGWFKGT
jgi:magnesium transporter